MLVVLSGPEGAGKTQFQRIAHQIWGFQPPLAVTTRDPRNDESPGQSYEFVDRSAFIQLIREKLLLDWDYWAGAFYGYRLDVLREVDDHGYAAMPVTAQVAIRLRYRYECVRSVYLDVTEATQQRRLMLRQQSERNWLRLLLDREQASLASLFDLIVDANSELSEETVRATLTELEGAAWRKTSD